MFPGVTEKLAALALDPIEVPSVATVYQLMLLPAEVAFRLTDEPAQTLAGEAVTEVGTVGRADTVTVAVTALLQAFPLVIV